MKRIWFGASAMLAVSTYAVPACAVTANYSLSWLNQISLPSSIVTGAKGGAGMMIGIVDTGLNASSAEIAGRVSSLSSCAAVTFKCSNGFSDDNGHGTAVAAIAAGAYNGTSAIMSGPASGVTIVSEKVLNASGSGYDADVANGIVKAANAGANVINLSLTYAPTAAEVSAINYATAKGAVIVFAGGNSSVNLNNGSNTNGLTAASLSRILFVGSVNSSNVKSSFSNTPGTAGIVVGGKLTTYSSVWLMAPGESIVAPNNPGGANSWAYWTGTSMAAPIVAGSVALLEKTWPVLNRNGTATAVLLATATDLGPAGADATYGVGLLNMTKAFQPIGALSAVGPSGRTVSLGGGTSAIVSSTTLGTLKTLSTTLASYTIFDGYSRNFTGNLSSLITKPASSSVSLSSLVYTPVWTNTTAFVGGGRLDVLRDTTPAFGAGEAEHAAYGLQGFTPHAPSGYVSYASAKGLMFSGGYGVSSLGGYSQALWGGGGAAEEAAAKLGASNALSAMAQGGYSASLGLPLGEHMRLAAGWSATPQDRDLTAPYAMASRQAKALSVGVQMQASSRISLAANVSSLDERNGLLGAAYTQESALNLGDQHSSVATSLMAVIDLGGGASLAFDATQTASPSRVVTRGLIASTSALRARAFGAALTLTDVAYVNDRVTFSVRQPLHLTSGYADIATTTVDEDGYNHTSLTRASLTGGPVETDYGMSYSRHLNRRTQVETELSWRQNTYGNAGQNDFAFRAVVQSRF
jgi:subtilisin family serine protease